MIVRLDTGILVKIPSALAIHGFLVTGSDPVSFRRRRAHDSASNSAHLARAKARTVCQKDKEPGGTRHLGCHFYSLIV